MHHYEGVGQGKEAGGEVGRRGGGGGGRGSTNLLFTLLRHLTIGPTRDRGGVFVPERFKVRQNLLVGCQTDGRTYSDFPLYSTSVNWGTSYTSNMVLVWLVQVGFTFDFERECQNETLVLNTSRHEKSACKIKTHPFSIRVLQVPTAQLAKMSINLKFGELTADVLEIKLYT